MCGIAGVLGQKEKTEKIIDEMVKIISHRGPDDQGLFTDDLFSFGMRRLSIIDLGGGKQPISNENDTVTVVFNGEIYNYQSIREDLQKKGHIFKTDSDTETLVHLYEEKGSNMLNDLRGMFGFAIFDKNKQSLFIARDYFGIKPIYYRMEEGRVISFGSEIKSLLVDQTFKREVNDEAVYNYLSYQYNPLEETMFKNIYSLAPGSYLEIDLKTGKYKVEKYWHYTFNQENIPENVLAKKIETAMRDSVRHHMISDVPVGAFLSGGIDSAVIVTLVQEWRKNNNQGNVSTFTIGFDHVSEHSEAKVMADFLGTDHQEILISFDEYFNELPKIAWHFDEPVADPSAVALYFLAREARKKVKVVLSGEGSDELFGGYNIYREPFALAITNKLPSFVINGLIKPVTNLPFNFFGKNYLKRSLQTLEERYIGNAYIFKQAEKDLIWKGSTNDIKPKKYSLKSDFDNLSKDANKNISIKITDSMKMQYIDINHWMPGDILAKADKMTMANSLELRVPFLDIEIAKLSGKIPENLKYKDGKTKYILRKAFESVLPRETADRKKLGFPTPIKQWLKSRPDDISKIILENKYINEKFNTDYIKKLVENHVAGKVDNARKIYILLMLSLWYNQFLK